MNSSEFYSVPVKGKDGRIGLPTHRSFIASKQPGNSPLPDMSITNILVETDFGHVLAELYRSEKACQQKPYKTLFFVPGTAFIAFEHSYTRLLCSHLLDSLSNENLQIIVIKHRLAPENKKEAILGDVVCAFDYFLSHAAQEKYAMDANSLLAAGYSSGATIVLQALLQYLSRKNDKPANKLLHVFALSPITDFSSAINEVAELRQYAAEEELDRVVSAEFVEFFYSMLFGDTYRYPQQDAVLNSPARKDPNISLAHQPAAEKEKYPSITTVVGEFDRFRRHSEQLQQELHSINRLEKHLVLAKQDHSYAWESIDSMRLIAQQIRRVIGCDTIPLTVSMPADRIKKNSKKKVQQSPLLPLYGRDKWVKRIDKIVSSSVTELLTTINQFLELVRFYTDNAEIKNNYGEKLSEETRYKRAWM